jgi:hypothetical protein
MQESYEGTYVITFQMNHKFPIIYWSAQARFHLSSFFFLFFPYLFFSFMSSYFGLILGLFLISGFCKIISVLGFSRLVCAFFEPSLSYFWGLFMFGFGL